MVTAGRGVWNRKTRVDEACSIDIFELQRQGAFKEGLGLPRTLSWSRYGKVVGFISYRVEADLCGPTGLRLQYSITANGADEKKSFDYVVPLESTPCNYGGKRWWFLCCTGVGRNSCQRRCRIIYMPPGAEYFLCRECHRLTYESRQRHREAFYEGFEKPFLVMDAANQKLTKAKSWKKRGQLLKKLNKAHAAILAFNSRMRT